MLRIVLQGIRGQRKTAFLMSLVLVISFLFLTVSSGILHSVQSVRQEERETLYGRFQLLFYGNSSTAQKLLEEHPDSRISEIVGQTSSGKTVASFSPEFQEYANLTLRQGRFPEKPGEILLVGPDAWGYQTGETVKISYVFHHGTPDNGEREKIQNQIREILLQSFWENSEKYLAQMEKFWNSFISSQRATELYGDSMLKPLEELLPYQQEQAFLFAYGSGVLRDFASSAAIRYPKDQFSVNEMQIYLDFYSTEQTLSGEAFGEYRGTVFASKPVLTDTRIDVSYTICGIAEDYKSNWVTGGLNMPDAFIGTTDHGLVWDALSLVEQRYPETLPQSSSALLLWATEPGDYTAFLDSYNSLYHSSYQMLGQSSAGNQSRGYLAGVDPATGEKIYCEVTGNYVTIGETNQYFSRGDLTDPAFRLEGLDPLPQEPVTEQSLYDNNTGILRINSLAYPPVGDSTGTIERLLQGVLICMSVCSCFQIYLQSLKRRRQKLDTLIAIGATDGQLVAMLLMEVALLLVISWMIGAVLGFFASWMILTQIMNIPAVWQVKSLLLSYGCMAGAVLLGVLLPIIKILREQLQKNKQKALILPVYDQRRFGPGYKHICLRHIRANSRQMVLRSVIVLLLCAILLLPVFLIHRSYNDYRQNVIYADRPEYELQLPYAASQRYLDEIMYDVDIPAQKLRSYVTAENVYLHCDTVMEDSPILQALASDIRGAELFRKLEDGSTGFPVRMVGSTWDSQLVQTILEELSNPVDQEAFEKGKACILLVPRYRERGGEVVLSEISQEVLSETSQDLQMGMLLDSSLRKVYAGSYQEDSGLLAMDSVTISGYTQKLKNSGSSLAETVNTVQVNVAAAVCQLDTPLWPFSEEAAITVLCSSSLLDDVYPDALTRMSAQDSRYFRVASQLYYPYCYGKTYIQIWSDTQQMDTASQERRLMQLCDSFDFDLTKFHFYNGKLLENAENSSGMYLILCLNMVFITALLLSNLLREEAEEDSRRLGILQVLGMTDRQYLVGQGMQMLVSGIVSIFALHAVLLLALCLGFLIQGGGISQMMLRLKLALQDFPVWWDLVLSIVYLLALQIMQLHASLAIIRKSPVENIRQ